MKKLMFAAAALVAGFAMADESGIASVNIVGYQGAAVPTLSSAGMPTFVALNADRKLSIQDIKISCTGDLDDGAIQLYEVSPDSSFGTGYYWIASAGFWTEDGENPAEAVFDEGVGFILDNGSEVEGVSVTYSGEVINGATLVPIQPLTSASGNMTPVNLDIQRFTVECEGDLDDGAIQLYQISPDSSFGTGYYWIASAGFWTEDGENPAEFTFDAGKGFMVDNGSEVSGAYLKIPSPLE